MREAPRTGPRGPSFGGEAGGGRGDAEYDDEGVFEMSSIAPPQEDGVSFIQQYEGPELVRRD